MEITILEGELILRAVSFYAGWCVQSGDVQEQKALILLLRKLLPGNGKP